MRAAACLASLVFAGYLVVADAQETDPARGAATVLPVLPVPPGRFAVGRVSLELIDASRRDATAARPTRELAVDVWYPAEPAVGPTAAYIDRRAFADPGTTLRLREYLRGAFDAVASSRVRTHAIENAPFVRSLRRAPLLVFSHGGGETKETYSVQLEALASLGYVVAAVSHTYDAAVTFFPDGRSVLFAAQRWPRDERNVADAPTNAATKKVLAAQPASQVANFQQLRWWADDIRFVATRLRESRAGSWPFAGRVDPSRIGALGHSFGGMAAATACQIDSSIRACLDEDGLFARMPYVLDTRGWGMKGSFMLLVREGPVGPPPADELARMHLTAEEAIARAAQMDERQDATLRNTGKGGYRVTLTARNTSHYDFGDLPLLQSATPEQAQQRSGFLSGVIDYVDAFFAEALNGKSSDLLRPRENASGVLIRRTERSPGRPHQ